MLTIPRYDVVTPKAASYTARITHRSIYYEIVLGLVEQGLTSHSTQFRSFSETMFYRSDDPTNSVKALKEGG